MHSMGGWFEDCPSNGRSASETGPEAIVRTLLQTVSIPFTKPARPQKIVVRDRDSVFLRGVLKI